MEVRECSPPILKTSMAGPVGGDAEESVAPTNYFEDIDGGPLGGDDGDPRAPTTNFEDTDGRPHGR
jgi:hypothetical protein